MPASQRMRASLSAARTRARERARRRVLQWVWGPESNFPGDPRRQLIMDHTVSADARLVQYDAATAPAVRIGRYSGITHSAVVLQDGMHHDEWVSVVHARVDENGNFVIPKGMTYSRGPVIIGSDVLIAYEAMILSGVTIGHGAVVSARAVVSRNVKPYEVVAGNPLRHVRYRFDEPTRAALLRIAWWDWPDEKVTALRHEIDSPDVQGFIERHDPGPPSSDAARADGAPDATPGDEAAPEDNA